MRLCPARLQGGGGTATAGLTFVVSENMFQRNLGRDELWQAEKEVGIRRVSSADIRGNNSVRIPTRVGTGSHPEHTASHDTSSLAFCHAEKQHRGL